MAAGFARVENGTVIGLLLMCGALALEPSPQQDHLDRRELATYRLTTPVYERFADASHRIAIVLEGDPTFRAAPLFSQEIVQGGDVIDVSTTLEQRLLDHPGLSRALGAAAISARDYTKFALTLVAARLALGFLDAGVLKNVPSGAATENVAFVRAHRPAVDELLTELGIELWRSPRVSRHEAGSASAFRNGQERGVEKRRRPLRRDHRRRVRLQMAQREFARGTELLHLFERPNRFGVTAFYPLHEWARKAKPRGCPLQLAPEHLLRGLQAAAELISPQTIGAAD